jgi:diazepam-binding inhibitor (GABA receptor modulating acyl-CoA-binding protein)
MKGDGNMVSLGGLEGVFAACVAAVRRPFTGEGEPPIRPSTSDKLLLYGLFKQATVGDNTRPAPWRWQLTEYAKWHAWSSQHGSAKADAKLAYVRAVQSLLPPASVPIADQRAAADIRRLREQIADSLATPNVKH